MFLLQEAWTLSKSVPVEEEKGKEVTNVATEHVVDSVLATTEKGDELTKHTWITDSIATCHITNNNTGVYNVETISDKIKLGQGREVHVKLLGDLD